MGRPVTEKAVLKTVADCALSKAHLVPAWPCETTNQSDAWTTRRRQHRHQTHARDDRWLVLSGSRWTADSTAAKKGAPQKSTQLTQHKTPMTATPGRVAYVGPQLIKASSERSLGLPFGTCCRLSTESLCGEPLARVTAWPPKQHPRRRHGIGALGIWIHRHARRRRNARPSVAARRGAERHRRAGAAPVLKRHRLRGQAPGRPRSRRTSSSSLSGLTWEVAGIEDAFLAEWKFDMLSDRGAWPDASNASDVMTAYLFCNAPCLWLTAQHGPLHGQDA